MAEWTLYRRLQLKQQAQMQAQMAGAEQLEKLTADLADQHDFRQMLGFLAHHNRQGALQKTPQEAPQEHAAFAEESMEEGKEIAGGGGISTGEQSIL